MAALSINIPDAIDNRLIRNAALTWGWQAKVTNPLDPEGPKIDNPQNARAFCREYWKAQFMFAAKLNEVKEAREAAEVAAQAKADAELIGVT